MKFRHLGEKNDFISTLQQCLTEPIKTRERAIESALNAMLTQFGMDEDEWNTATFKQAREALAMKGTP